MKMRLLTMFLIIKEGFLMVRMNKLELLEASEKASLLRFSEHYYKLGFRYLFFNLNNQFFVSNLCQLLLVV